MGGLYRSTFVSASAEGNSTSADTRYVNSFPLYWQEATHARQIYQAI